MREQVDELHRLMQYCFKHDGPYHLYCIFYTDADGNLFVDDEFVRRAEEAARSGALSG